MKDIKTFLIGFLSCACMFLFMGFSPKYDWSRSQFKIHDSVRVHNGNAETVLTSGVITLTDERMGLETVIEPGNITINRTDDKGNKTTWYVSPYGSGQYGHDPFKK